MQKYKEVPSVEKVLTHVCCNKCGTEMTMPEEMFADEIPCYHEFDTGFSCNSRFDMQLWNFELCESCLLDIVKTFKIMPDGFASGEKYPEEIFIHWQKIGEVDYEAGWTEEDHKEENERKEKFNKHMEWATKAMERLGINKK